MGGQRTVKDEKPPKDGHTKSIATRGTVSSEN